MPLRVVYPCKAGCGHVTELVADLLRNPSASGWVAIEGTCPACGAYQFDEDEPSTKRQFRPDDIPA